MLLTNDSHYSYYLKDPSLLTIFMSMSCHHNDLAALAGISLSLPSSHTKLFLLFVLMVPMIFTYSFTIDGYDVTITITCFPHVIVLEDSSPYIIDDESENVDMFLYRWAIFCINILPLGCFLHKHFIAGLFSAETLYCWVISYNMFF